MSWTPEILLQLLVALGSGFGAYAAIRADLARLNERASQALESATRAHERINSIADTRH